MFWQALRGSTMGVALDAARRVLAEADKPLHYREIAKQALQKGYWQTTGKTPEATINAQIVVNMRKRVGSFFRRVAPGTYQLADTNPAKTIPTVVIAVAPGVAGQPKMSFTDAAEKVLCRQADRKPMHYRSLTDKAMELGLIATSGRTPEATMYSSIFQEIHRYRKRGERPRFLLRGKGLVGLSKWAPTGIPSQIDQHNRAIRKKLHEQLRSMDPGDFEALIGKLLGKLGFGEVTVTARTGDGGIDVRGTLVVGDVIRTRVAVQVKRWKHNVHSPIVQQVRGSLGAHEHGLIITTSDFSAGAKQEADRPDREPVWLMDGEQLVSLLVENAIGIHKTQHELLEIGETTAEGQDA
jgi:restriction system protein